MTTLIERLQDALGSAWRVERELPLGGLGRSFLGADVASGRQVVVQVLPPDVAVRTDAARFRAAVGRAARLRHHGILAVGEAGGVGDLLWCITGHASGESLRFRLLREGGLIADEARQVLRDAADALAYAHERGVCHGDLKPDNIYLRDGRASLADFGVLWALHEAGGGGGVAPTPAGDLQALAASGRAMLAGGPAAVPEPVAAVERYTSAAQFRDALGETTVMRRRRTVTRRAAAAAILLVVGGVFAARAWRARAVLDPDLVAIVPFEIFDTSAEHAVWREGLVDVMAANLDGAGPLQTVPPSLAIRRWNGGYDDEAAALLGRATGARMVVAGRVVRTAGDSMRLTARLLDVVTGAHLSEVALIDPAGRMDRLADSLTVQLLRDLGRMRPIGAVRRASLGASSLPALKAYLLGEQHYRRTRWDSAMVAYQRAVSLDTSFTMAYYRAGLTLGWLRSASDSLSVDYLLRAAERNRGLPARDSLLIVAESLGIAVSELTGPEYWRAYRRLYAVIDLAVRRYPNDAEIWYQTGEVRYHYPFFSNTSDARAAFDRAIALDSLYAPAYIHPIDLSLQLGETARARTYIDGYLRLDPRDANADGIRLTRLLLDPRRVRTDAVRQVLDTASADLLGSALSQFRGWADSTETGILITRILVRGRPGSGAYSSPGDEMAELISALAYQGRISEARALSGDSLPWLVGSAALLGAMPEETARQLAAQSLRRDPLWPRSAAVMSIPWFASVRDTVSLRELGHRADSLARGGSAFDRAYGAYLAGATRAFTVLAGGDTVAALRALMALPDTACERCVTIQVARGLLLDAARADRSAADLLSRDTPGDIYPTDGLWILARGRVAERLGDRVTALASYRFVRDVWINADPPLQHWVDEARAGLGRLGVR